jgi:hypothetical protein
MFTKKKRLINTNKQYYSKILNIAIYVYDLLKFDNLFRIILDIRYKEYLVQQLMNNIIDRYIDVYNVKKKLQITQEKVLFVIQAGQLEI